MKKLLITIDGPAGAGKTTVSRALAERLGYRYIDTGALYRGVAYEIKHQCLNPEDDAELQQLCRSLRLKFVADEKGLRLFSDGVDISDQIRTPEISMLASAVSAKSIVRDSLLAVQRDIGKEKEAVFEGRDMGTVVFPDADVKFYLDASTKVRASRRYHELQSKTVQTLEAVERDMQRRDKNDRTRNLAPLKPAADSILIDSTESSVSEVVELMLSIIDKKRNIKI
jgi:cytidylate kinase